MYKIMNFDYNLVQFYCVKSKCCYNYIIREERLYTDFFHDNVWKEHALDAESFIKKWLTHNKEWVN